MAQITTDGIVLGSTKLGEADRILRVLTRDIGKISAVAKGVRRGKSKFSGCLEPMMVNAFLLAEGRNMYIVCQVENQHSYGNIRADYSRICRAGKFLEAAGKLTEEGLPDPAGYELLINALDALEDGTSPDLVELLYKTRLLQEHGVFPPLSGCGTCGQTRTSAIHFDGAQMAFICDGCAKAVGVHHPVSRSALDGVHWASLTGDVGMPGESLTNADDAIHLADEMLAAFIQGHIGSARGRNHH